MNKKLPRWFETFFAILKRIEAGRMEISLPDGRVFVAEGRSDGPGSDLVGRIDVHNPDFFARMVREGELGFCEMYLEGWWDSPDLQAVFDVVMLNNDNFGRGFPGAGLFRAYERLRHMLRANTRTGSRRNISYHYDLGNDFYRLWLDETMTYSSALFTPSEADLVQAQERKYAAVCDGVGISEGDHILEIGCGWGGFAEHAIRERGARVTGLTLSREQHDYAKRRLFEAGLAERADIVLRDYRDERGIYDGVASIEMFEAVGERYWKTYFRALRDRLRPGGSAVLQVITIADHLFAEYRRSTDFVQKYIFPGGMLPSPSAFQSELRRAGLEMRGALQFGESYSRTLRTWRGRFNERWQDVTNLGFDERFGRMWNLYLASCAACFHAGTTDVVQFSLNRSG